MQCSESRKRKHEEYEMQLFGFHSRAVNATLKNVVVDRIKSRSKKLCDTLRKKYELEPEKLVILKKNEEKLIRMYCKASRPHLKNLENIVNKFITVPSNVLSDIDKLQETQYTETEVENMRKKLEDLQQRTKRATIMRIALNRELQLIKQFSMRKEDVDRLDDLFENSVKCPNVTSKIHQLVTDYKKFNSSLSDEASTSQKSFYNTIDNLKCIDYDVDSL